MSVELGIAFALVLIVVSSGTLMLYAQARDQHEEVVRLVNLLATFIGEQKKS